ncbi:glycosyltransferase family 61 protein [Pontibacter cellulosilyticus]|uniref:Glycosyltransferase family 61 protein n=1 Tax=Pontibacter cellulosilyticus TaxID=1720253 RepID=A0A923N7E5_9BACT|nr:glycosyltransferase family 61 protein [Pontibacter cellulosilyticus]MBC5994275.1 glycosyltransferase family 61 protein [Pontibacter cellulosilyticus]
MDIKTFYRKGLKRTKKILGRIIPYNTHYKPGDVCSVNLDHPNRNNTRELTVHKIYPNYETKLNISDDLFHACSEYWKPKRQVVTNYMVLEVPDGRVYTDNESSVAIISRYNRVIENVSLSLVSGKVTQPNLNNIFEQRYFTVPEKYKGTVFSLLTGGAGINNIGHWFIDVLPRLHLLRQSGLYDKVDWFLMPSLRYDYQVETLELLGIPLSKVIEGDKHPHIAADCIIASTAPRGNHTLIPEWLCAYIQESFLPYAEEEGDIITPEIPYLYISRSDSSIRNVLNEKELLNALEPYGFKSIVSSKLSIREKIKLFSRAKVVLGATGAGLISMFFCKPGTKIIEIFNEGFVVEPFYDIATKLDLDYEYMICKNRRKVKNAAQGQREHLFVETDKVLAILENMEQENQKSTKQAEVA